MQRTIARLFKYQHIIKKLSRSGLKKISSSYLAEKIDVSPSQVRKDFSLLNIKGQKRGGYAIIYLLKRMDEIIHPSAQQQIIIIGMGKIGQALADRYNSKKDRISVVAGFDLEASTHNGLAIHPIEELSCFVKNKDIKVAVICVPDHVAQKIGKLLKKVGITGILNFTGIDLLLGDHVWIKNINISLDLKNIFYHVEHSSVALTPAQPLPRLE